jgi:hydrogenase maturation protease
MTDGHESAPHTLVLGIGNILLRDEGVGVRLVEQLQQRYDVPERVQILDGGTMGLDLMATIEGVGQLLVIDAVQANLAPGEHICLYDDAIPTFLGRGMSPHQIGLSDILSVARLRDMLPRRVALLGVQPALVETGLELSPTIAAQMERLEQVALDILREWGIVLPSHTARCAIITDNRA